jgi:hypothetical protein
MQATQPGCYLVLFRLKVGLPCVRAPLQLRLHNRSIHSTQQIVLGVLEFVDNYHCGKH